MTTQIPQGYKQTSIGIIPDDWEVKKMKEIAKVQGGYAFDSRKFTSHGKFQVVKMSNVYNGNLDLERSGSYLPILTAQEEKFKLNHDDILITLTGTIGKRDYGYSYRIIDEENLVLNQRVARLITKKECANPIYLSYEVKTKRLLNQFFFSTRGGTGNQANVGTGDVELLKVALPPLPEQQKIAEILSTWDTAIETCQKTIEQLKQRNKGLAQQFLTPAENWQKYKVKDVLKEISRPVSWDDEKFYDLISVRRRSGGIFYRQTLQGKEILTKNLSTVKNGDFLISKMQIVHGASALVCENFENMNVSGSYIVTGCRNEEIMDIRFFNYLSKTKRFYHLSYISSYGVHIEKMTFDFKDFQNHSITLPSIAKQKEIITILDTAANELRLYQDKLCYLQNQKKGLMQQLLTGRVRTI